MFYYFIIDLLCICVTSIISIRRWKTFLVEILLISNPTDCLLYIDNFIGSSVTYHLREVLRLFHHLATIRRNLSVTVRNYYYFNYFNHENCQHNSREWVRRTLCQLTSSKITKLWRIQCTVPMMWYFPRNCRQNNITSWKFFSHNYSHNSALLSSLISVSIYDTASVFHYRVWCVGELH